jgi:26S proteasome regulatory subunit T5
VCGFDVASTDLCVEQFHSYDSRVKAMEVDEKPKEEYTDVGGLDKQIEELVEAVVLPMTQAERFKTVGITPPKGVLLHGPPGTGKTLLARACAKQTDAVFLKLAGPQLVQMYIGDGAKMVRDAFELAKEKCKERNGAIIFIDEVCVQFACYLLLSVSNVGF